MAVGSTLRASFSLSGLAVATAGNQLIDSLPDADRRSLLALAKKVQLTKREMLGRPGTPARFVYFPIDSFISLFASIDGKPVLEVGMVGREGLFGAQLALRVQTQPLHALVQGPGTSWQVPAPAFRLFLERSHPLQRAMGQYVYILMIQLASSGACTRFHHIHARLARWLLMMQDRADADTFGVTHEFLAYMLGVRRVSITTAAVALHKKGLVAYHRGSMTIVDRRGLKGVACSCYDDEKRASRQLTR